MARSTRAPLRWTRACGTPARRWARPPRAWRARVRLRVGARLSFVPLRMKKRPRPHRPPRRSQNRRTAAGGRAAARRRARPRRGRSAGESLSRQRVQQQEVCWALTRTLARLQPASVSRGRRAEKTGESGRPLVAPGALNAPSSLSSSLSSSSLAAAGGRVGTTAADADGRATTPFFLNIVSLPAAHGEHGSTSCLRVRKCQYRISKIPKIRRFCVRRTSSFRDGDTPL